MIRWIILLLTLLLLLLTGCTRVEHRDYPTEIPQIAEYSSEAEYSDVIYFPNDDPHIFIQTIEAGETVYPDEIFQTNTTCFTVKNTGSITLVCNLYYPDHPEDFILTNVIEPGKKVKFTNLISTLHYQIALVSDQDGTIEVTVNG